MSFSSSKYPTLFDNEGRELRPTALAISVPVFLLPYCRAGTESRPQTDSDATRGGRRQSGFLHTGTVFAAMRPALLSTNGVGSSETRCLQGRFLLKALHLLASQASFVFSLLHLTMAPMSDTYPLHILFTIGLILLVPLATTTLMNPLLEPEISCFPPDIVTIKPTAYSCGSAIAGLPQSNEPIDYHRDPATGHVTYNTALTSIGDPSSPLHLPQSSWSGNCRIDVRMSPPAPVAQLLWDDVRQAARALVERCVGGTPTVSSPPSPGGGGSAQYGSVLIAIFYTPYGNSGVARGFPGSAPSRPGSNAGENYRIGAYYPPGAQA